MGADKEKLDSEVSETGTAVASIVTAVAEALGDATGAISRLLAKIEAGNAPVDYQSETDQLDAIQQKLTDLKAQVESAAATFKVEGN